jgi:hypothetical protein
MSLGRSGARGASPQRTILCHVAVNVPRVRVGRKGYPGGSIRRYVIRTGFVAERGNLRDGQPYSYGRVTVTVVPCAG